MMNSHDTAPATGVPPVSPAPLRAGFTLIEVLVAVIIIGLGMIGLSALFAGAARQQQLVSQSSRGTTAARNTESKIIETFSGFRDVGDLAKCLYGGVIGDVPVADRLGVEWIPVNANLENALSIFDPPETPDATTNCVWAYFEKPIEGFTMYDVRGAANPTSLPQEDAFDGANQAISTFGTFNPYFPVRSVVGDTLEIDVYLASDGVTDPTDPEFPPGNSVVRKVTYHFDPVLSPQPLPQGCNGNAFRLIPKVPDPQFAAQGYTDPNDPRDYDFIEINSFKCPSSGETKLELSPLNAQFAEINKIQIFGVKEAPKPGFLTPAEPTPRTGRYIQRVEVRSCTHRETTLLSMSDRIVSEVGADGATRDVAGISVMMRGDGTGSGNMLAAVFSYALQANREGARFIPADRAGDPNLTRPIRSARVALVYNTDTESYWFYCSRATPTLEADESFLARQGQTVLFAGNALAGLPGADGVSKVTRVVQLSRGRGYWCELERAPRAGAGIAGLAANAVVPVINFPFAPSSAAGAAGNFVVYAVNNVASSRVPPVSGGGGTATDVIEATPQWQLRPIEARVFTISR